MATKILFSAALRDFFSFQSLVHLEKTNIKHLITVMRVCEHELAWLRLLPTLPTRPWLVNVLI